MFKRIAIITGSVLLLTIIITGLVLIKNSGADSSTISDFTVQKSYLSKSTETYARCYNSINYGQSLIGDVRLEILSENFDNKSINSDRLDPVQESFMQTVKDKCQKTVDDYELAYKKALEDQATINNASSAWWQFLTGSNQRQLASENITNLQPASARMSIAFNDYVFTSDDVKTYFKAQLAL